MSPRHRAVMTLNSQREEKIAARGPIKHRAYVQARLNAGLSRHRAEVPADVHWRAS